MSRWAKVFCALVILLGVGAVGCLSRVPADTDTAANGLAGILLEYRFESGRRYQAFYAERAVSFELLEPLLAEPPKGTLPYRAKPIRDGLFLVSWEEIEFAPVFLIDLRAREIHTRARLENGESFFATAKIISLSRE